MGEINKKTKVFYKTFNRTSGEYLFPAGVGMGFAPPRFFEKRRCGGLRDRRDWFPDQLNRVRRAGRDEKRGFCFSSETGGCKKSLNEV